MMGVGAATKETTEQLMLRLYGRLPRVPAGKLRATRDDVDWKKVISGFMTEACAVIL